jgi:hypothetical protein
MIDPVDSLAFSLHSNKGVYAVLLGSGVSRSASIPTGWEITLELTRKVAALEGANCEPDPAAWFRASKGKDPDYSELLDALAKTQAERQQLLRPYWEPSDDEVAEGVKVPTKAHRAIASLVKSGYIRVVLTTNFDRLMEAALSEVGVQPVVLSTVDQIDGSLPLIHTPCTLIKIHGDYLDIRIRNTPDELAAYPEKLDRLLDRVFDEFGLIVSGWSADWDEALRSAITRAPNRRFSMYWCSRGEPSAKAQDLIGRRSAVLLRPADADTLFVSLAEKVKALEEFSRPHPLSAEVAVATLQRHLTEPKNLIAIDQLVTREATRVADAITGPSFPVEGGDWAPDNVERRVAAYEHACEALVRMGFVAGRWSHGAEVAPWEQAIQRLLSEEPHGGTVVWIELRRYPAALLLYSLGLGAVFANRPDVLAQLCSPTVLREHRAERRVVELASIWGMFQRGADCMKVLKGREKEYSPLNNRLHDLLLGLVGRQFPSSAAYSACFDRLEILIALAYGRYRLKAEGHGYWAPPGRFGWRNDSRAQIVEELRASITSKGNSSPYVSSGLIGQTSDEALANLKNFEEFVPKFRWY